jgi:pyruvate/2-oxoglutarate/acetoin dehydrogenase E1 component
MPARQRVADALNAALAAALAADDRLYLLGEDIADPYGGAFKITRGLSSRFPRQVLTTPISEAGIVGVANGLAMAGDKAIVEIMFGDFAALAFDQIVNFAAKSTAMYGRSLPVPVVVRCPTGGNRGYGPTHSQSLQKHFVGVPGLDVYEISQFHDPVALLAGLLAAGRPAMLFEDKTLYAEPMHPVGDLFRAGLAGDPPGTAEVRLDDDSPADDYLIIAPGGLGPRVLAAMRGLLVEHELSGRLLVPARLHPLDLAPLLPAAAAARQVLVAEDGPPGAAWGTEVAYRLQQALWGTLRRPVRLLQAADRVIPTAAHLEREVFVRADTIGRAILEAHR